MKKAFLLFKPGLRNRFILYFLPLIIGMLIQGGYCIYTLSSIHSHFEKMQQNAATDVSAMLELRRLLLSLEKGIRSRHIDPEKIKKKAEELDRIIKEHARQPHEPLNPGEKSAHEMLHHAIFATTLSKYILTRFQQGWPEDSEEFAEIADTIQEELDALETLNDQHLQQHIKQLANTELFISQKYRSTLVAITLTCTAVILLTATVFYLLLRSVLEPVRRLVEGTRQIGSGNLDYRLHIHSGDEFELLAKEFESMAEKLAHFHQELDRKVRERTAELVKANSELKKAEEQIHNLSQQLLAVQESERQQISLYLHDNVAQNLSSLKIACDSMFMDAAEGRQPEREEIRDLSKLLDHCIKTVRQLSYNLRPPGLEHMGLASAIADYCRDFESHHGISVQFAEAGVESLDISADHAINIYRLVQEALNNIKQHSGASEARITLIASYPRVILTVEDNGCGFDPDEGFRKALENRRFGLLGMRERVRMLGGTFRIHSAEGKGTRLVIEFPA